MNSKSCNISINQRAAGPIPYISVYETAHPPFLSKGSHSFDSDLAGPYPSCLSEMSFHPISQQMAKRISSVFWSLVDADQEHHLSQERVRVIPEGICGIVYIVIMCLQIQTVSATEIKG